MLLYYQEHYAVDILCVKRVAIDINKRGYHTGAAPLDLPDGYIPFWKYKDKQYTNCFVLDRVVAYNFDELRLVLLL